jgi:hypothetical protein
VFNLVRFYFKRGLIVSWSFGGASICVVPEKLAFQTRRFLGGFLSVNTKLNWGARGIRKLIVMLIII